MKTLKQLRNLTPRQFEESIATLLPKLGYKNIKLTSQTADSGYDISAYKDTKKVFFECKKYSANNKVGSRDVRIFADACRRKNVKKGIFITTGYFTSTVNVEQQERSIKIQFWDGDELLRQMKNSEKIDAFCIQCNKKIKGYYNQFDWKDKVAHRMNSEVMRKQVYAMKEDLVPKFPKRCDRCEHSYKCSNCQQEFDKRVKENKIYYKRLYCNDCYLERKKRNRLICIGASSILSVGVIGGIVYIIYLFIVGYSHASLILLLIFVLVSFLLLNSKN